MYIYVYIYIYTYTYIKTYIYIYIYTFPMVLGISSLKLESMLESNPLKSRIFPLSVKSILVSMSLVFSQSRPRSPNFNVDSKMHYSS